MLLPTSILYFEIQLFCISACLFKCCHTTSHYKIPFMPLSMFVSLYFSAFRLWTSLICLYICTSMCLYDCMCVFLYCCVPPFFQTTSKSHSCFRQLGKMKFRLQEFGPIHIANLWNPSNRIKIMMGKVGCIQIRTSSPCSTEKNFFKIFFGVWNILPRGFIGLLTKMAKNLTRSDQPLPSYLLITTSPKKIPMLKFAAKTGGWSVTTKLAMT